MSGRGRIAPLTLVGIAGLVALAGCGGGGSPSLPPAALGITDRLADRSLAGLPPEGPPVERRTPAELAADLGRGGASAKDVDTLTRAGFVNAAARTYRTGDAAAAYSFAVQAGSPQQARTLMRYLTESVLASYTTPHRVERRRVATIPQSLVADVRFTPRGAPPSEVTRIGFTDGPFAYLQIAAATPRVDGTALERDAVRLYRRVRGRPAP